MRQLVKVGRLGSWVPEAAQVAEPHVVGQEEDDVWSLLHRTDHLMGTS